MKLVLDIETVIDPDVPLSPPRPNMSNEILDRIAEACGSFDDCFADSAKGTALKNARSMLGELRPHSGSFPPPPCWKVVCVGIATLTERGLLDDLACLEGESEEEILCEVHRVFSEDKTRPFPEHDVITFNGRMFDIPVLTMRAARYGIQLPFWSSKWHYRYAESPHFDLLDFWTAYGGSPRVSLMQMGRLFGLPGKREGEDGASVAAMIQEDRLLDVQHYCLSDVIQTAGIFLRTEFFRGRLDRHSYRAAAMRLLAACEGAFVSYDALGWISEKTNRRLFLLEEEE
jgi:hypothetical protein